MVWQAVRSLPVSVSYAFRLCSCSRRTQFRFTFARNEGGLFGGERTCPWEVKFLDRTKTNYSEGILQGYLPQSRTKVWRSKMIRDHCSPHHKRWPPWIGEFLWRHLPACPGGCPAIKYSTYVHVLSSREETLCLDGNILSTFSYCFTRKLWGYSLRGEYVRKSET